MVIKKKGIGIFGGSFDPPHKAHLQISLISLKKIGLKKIYWVITKKNPFKNKPFFSLNERIKKSTDILKNRERIKVVFLDKILSSSRTIHTVNYFINKKNEKNLYLIVGSDSLLKFHKWKSWKKIVKLTKLVVFSRKGYDNKSKNSKVVKYLNKKNIIFVNNKFFNISSSKIRKKLK
ncbi:nicotinate (nicotinamide) nucleotide adenylyltransferase [Candidatus Pelagibacter bacterium]|nr:nicotinate (nicotinamide) nucleotide adenylyltransferase [Candidatus Pelagibacter bacterium]